MSSEKNVSEQSEAAQRLTQVLAPEAIDALVADAESTGTPIDGTDGLLNQLIKAVLNSVGAFTGAVTRPGRVGTDCWSVAVSRS